MRMINIANSININNQTYNPSELNAMRWQISRRRIRLQHVVMSMHV
jgi:hypothetical protein